MVASLVSEPILGGAVICRPQPLFFEQHSSIGFTLMSDLHLGASHVDLKLIKHDLDEAKKHNDRILINGDLLDLILAKDMKRYSPDGIHPRLHGRTDMVNAAIEWAVELLSPVASQIDMIGVGNHETAVHKYHGADPTAFIVHDLQRLVPKTSKHVIHYAGYTGFVDYRLRYTNNQKSHKGHRFTIYYHHGSGAYAPVTKGLIDFNRRDTFIDSDVIWLGHKHNRLTVAVQKLSCPINGDQVKVKDCRHIMTGAYFKTYVGQSQESIRKHGRRTNYAADAGLAPQGTGGARMELKFGAVDDPYKIKVIQ